MRPRRALQVVMSIAFACIVGYFLYHTIEGDRGWFALVRLQNEKAIAEQKLEALRQERQALDHRVLLMRPEGADPDLLDEEARKTLNYSKPNEIVILTPEPKENDPSANPN